MTNILLTKISNFHSLNRLFRHIFFAVFDNSYKDLDGVCVLNKSKRTNFKWKPMKWFMNLRYLQGNIIYFSFYLVTLIILAQYDFNYLKIPANVLPSQKLLPAQFSDQADIYFGFVLLIGTCGGINLLFHNMDHFNLHFRMNATLNADGTLEKIVQNGQVLSQKEAVKIFQLHKKAEKIIQGFFVLIQVECQPFYFYNIINNWKNTFVDFFIAIWAAIVMPYFVMRK